MTEKIDVHKIFAEYFKGCETLAYALSSKLSEGNICIDIKEYAGKLPGILEEQRSAEFWDDGDLKFWDFAGFTDSCCEGKFVSTSPGGFRPFIIYDGRAYLHRYFRYENSIIKNIERLGGRFHIITGGPGTGKTFSIANRLKEMFHENPDLKAALAAPTGKAAARMTESIRDYISKNHLEGESRERLESLKASTLHRLLGWISGSVFFRHNEANLLPFDVIIIDECSMIDGAMMAKLLEAVGNETELFLLGDKDQLASIEAGSVFGDLCRSNDSRLLKGKVELKTHNWRFSENEGIGRLSRLILNGSINAINEFGKDKQVIIDTEFRSDYFREYAMSYLEYICEPDISEALRKLNIVRFLCVTREDDNSVAATNNKICRLLKTEIDRRKKEGTISPGVVFSPKNGFYHNQPVIITKNDYTLGIFNGDTGIIRYEENVPYAWFVTPDAGIRKIQAGFLNDYETVFAMTIHKSQGSEFDNVMIIMPEKKAEKLLTRELLYTAVTRAKKQVIIQATGDVIRKCAENSVTRASGINQVLTAAE
ncbi:MAG TPA: exodeoxyribonuclease V subunit alpha [Bacteroidales bacterium]|nr:exodeoxyribonuclease V subunit alpha [Bacteroidales bacterium]